MKKIAVVAMMLMVSACFSLTNPSRFYQLKPMEGEVKAVSSRHMNIGIEEVYVPKYLDRPQIVTTKMNSAELKISEYSRWGEPLTNAFSRVLADDISMYMPKSLVKYRTYVSENFTYNVFLEINKLNAVLGQKVELDVWWTVYKNGKIITRKRTQLQAPITESYEKLVQTESALIADLAKEIARKISKL